MWKRSFVTAFAVSLFLGGGCSAKTVAPPEHDTRITDSFQQMIDLSLGTLLTPTVVELVFPPEAGTSVSQAPNDVIIVGKSKNTPESSLSSLVTLPAREFSPVFAVSAPEAGMRETSGSVLYDKDPTSYIEFSLPETGASGTAIVRVTTTTPEALTGFSFSLDSNVVPPTRVGVVASIDGVDKTVLSPVTGVFSRDVFFPRTMATEWKITFWYDQPLRISEFSFFAETGSLYERHLKFLAQPGEEYRLYVKPDRQFPRSLVTAASHLSAVAPVVSLPVGSMSPNPYYTPADTDGDGVLDKTDNCPQIANPGQDDVNRNAVGDNCEDFDKDGLPNNADNCPNLPNTNQQDTDGDGIGDTCDTEESRFTERHAWVPWVGMGTAIVVLIALFALTARKGIKEHPEDSV